MGGNVEAIKQRLDVVEVVQGYVKLEKAGSSWKGRCPFHNEKTASFFVSPVRQSYYCFGCGAKGDIFTLVQELEGVDFRTALKQLAERAGVELSHDRARGENKVEREALLDCLEITTKFFEEELRKAKEPREYLETRGVSAESVRAWRLGFVPDEWRTLYSHMTALGVSEETLFKTGLIKRPDESNRTPYDVFRGRVIFPLSDVQGRVIAFSGRALGAVEPKYLNSPDTALFTKSEVLYGLHQAKDEIRKKDYAVLVEGQMDLVLSHQAGVKNTVASSGTAFTTSHLERLKRLSNRVILAFDGDGAGTKAAEKSTLLGLSLGMEVKIARMPEGQDPADLVREDPEKWKQVLRDSKHAIEVILENVVIGEKDARKSGKTIVKKVLPLVTLLTSSIERSHFVSLIARKSGVKEEIIWDDLKKTPRPTVDMAITSDELGEEEVEEARPDRHQVLEEKRYWLAESPNDARLKGEVLELERLVRLDELSQEVSTLTRRQQMGEDVGAEVLRLNRERDALNTQSKVI